MSHNLKIMLEIYTDGSCSNNGSENAKASYAFIVLQNKRKVYEENGLVEGRQSNNTGELTAIKKAIQHAIDKDHESVLIYSDSRYCIDSLTIWDIEKTTKGKTKANYELIKSIMFLMECIDVSFEWVKGHNDNYFNDMADQLATKIL